MINFIMSSRIHFSITDILRILAGFLALAAIASWQFTGTTTWGYQGKYLDKRFWKHKFEKDIHLDLQQLANYNGKDTSLPIYLAINGSIYDVSSASGIYGPQGSYRVFAGRDCARAFVSGCFMKPDELTHDLRGLDEDEIVEQLTSWQKFFDEKYWKVGSVSLPEPTGDVPSECLHRRFPGHG